MEIVIVAALVVLVVIAIGAWSFSKTKEIKADDLAVVEEDVPPPKLEPVEVVPDLVITPKAVKKRKLSTKKSTTKKEK